MKTLMLSSLIALTLVQASYAMDTKRIIVLENDTSDPIALKIDGSRLNIDSGAKSEFYAIAQGDSIRFTLDNPSNFFDDARAASTLPERVKAFPLVNAQDDIGPAIRTQLTQKIVSAEIPKQQLQIALNGKNVFVVSEK